MPAEPENCPHCNKSYCGNSTGKFNVSENFRNQIIENLTQELLKVSEDVIRVVIRVVIELHVCKLSKFSHRYGESYLANTCFICSGSLDWYYSIPEEELSQFKLADDLVVETIRNYFPEDELVGCSEKRISRIIKKIEKYNVQSSLDLIWYNTHALKLIDSDDNDEINEKLVEINEALDDSEEVQAAFQDYYSNPGKNGLKKLLKFTFNL